MVVIIGGGLAGMSVAHHLGNVPHVVLESEADAGGLCRTRDVDGFLFDYTGHLLHLRDERITKLIHELHIEQRYSWPLCPAPVSDSCVTTFNRRASTWETRGACSSA